MRSETLGSVVRRLRQAIAPHAAAPRPDGPDAELVRAFATHRDAAAFEAIVRRHGPMVLGVCRRVLCDPADADDAFQATFLVLVRRAGSLRRPDRLAGWLHQVAQRTARKLRAARVARARREGELFDGPAGEAAAEFVWRELRPIFDQELGRLPDKLRLPAVLCFLEGHSKGEAARTLGWPEGTLAGRLQQAREKLRARFAARGLTLSAGALAVALFEGVGAAAVSNRLISSTLQAAATGPAGAAGAGAWVLADGVTQAMFHTKVKAVAACVLVAGLVGTGTGVVLVPGSGPGEVAAAQTKGGPAKATPSAPAQGAPAAHVESNRPARDPDRAVLEAELDLLKERAAWEEQMVKKGFMTEAQLKKTRAAVAKAEAELAKLDAPKAPDPRRAAMEEIVKKAEEIVAKTEEGVRRGIVPQQDLFNAQMKVLEYKLKLAELEPRPAAESAASRLAPNRDPVGLDELYEVARRKERELNRAEALFKQNAISLQDLRRLRTDMSRTKAELAAMSGDFAAAAKHHEAVVSGWEAEAAEAKRLADQGGISQAELRSVEVSLAEAKVQALKAGIRRQLADIVRIRERDLADARIRFEAKATSAEEVRNAEQALTQAKLRLAEER